MPVNILRTFNFFAFLSLVAAHLLACALKQLAAFTNLLTRLYSLCMTT